MTIILQAEDEFGSYKQIEYSVPFRGYRRYVALAYMGVNAVGFAANFWVLYTVAPLLFSATIKVPKSILFYIMTLCISDLMIMTGMLFLIIEIVVGTWKFSTSSCVAYLVFEAMNKFVAPVIVVLISRTCYVTVCLDPKSRQMAASLKYAVAQVMASMALVVIMLWPLFAYSQVSSLYFNVNVTMGTVNVLRKCTFTPPSEIELGFGIISCIASYAIPLGGIIYWYVSVPFFLRKHAENSLVSSNSNSAPLRRLTATVLVLTAVYVLCWSPYWLSIFAHKFMTAMSRTVVIASYFIHLLPYISCSAYPVIFTLMNRRIKTARAQMQLHFWTKCGFSKSFHSLERFQSAQSLVNFLRDRLQLLLGGAHQIRTDSVYVSCLIYSYDKDASSELLRIKQLPIVVITRLSGTGTKISKCSSVESLNALQLVDSGLTTSRSKMTLPEDAQPLEAIEMEEGDSML